MGEIRAVIFDLDGLLVDSEPAQIAAWERYLARYGHALDPVLLRDMFGLRVRDSARLIQAHYGLPGSVDDVLAGRDAIFFELLRGNVRPMPGALALIERLRQTDLRLGLATSGHRRYVDTVLAELGLTGAFAAEVTGDDVERGKPAPDIYLAAARALGVDPAACVALEDAPKGIASAKAAGMRCLAVPNEHTASLPGLDEADAVLGSLEEVPDWIARQARDG